MLQNRTVCTLVNWDGNLKMTFVTLLQDFSTLTTFTDRSLWKMTMLSRYLTTVKPVLCGDFWFHWKLPVQARCPPIRGVLYIIIRCEYCLLVYERHVFAQQNMPRAGFPLHVTEIHRKQTGTYNPFAAFPILEVRSKPILLFMYY